MYVIDRISANRTGVCSLFFTVILQYSLERSDRGQLLVRLIANSRYRPSFVFLKRDLSSQ